MPSAGLPKPLNVLCVNIWPPTVVVPPCRENAPSILPSVNTRSILTPITVELTVTLPAMVKLLIVDINLRLVVRLRTEANVAALETVTEPLQISDPVPAIVVL